MKDIASCALKFLAKAAYFIDKIIIKKLTPFVVIKNILMNLVNAMWKPSLRKHIF